MHGDVSLTTDRFGNEDCAYFFPGVFPENSIYTLGDTSAYLYLTDPDINLDANYFGGWSLSLWYQGGSSEQADLENIFTRKNNISNFNASACYEIILYDLNTPLITVFHENDNNHYIWAEQSEANLDSNIWHHAVLVVDYPSAINFYLDNELQGSIENPNLGSECSDNLWIGYNFHGKIDDIYFYHTALNEIQIDSLFTIENSCGTFTDISVNEYPYSNIKIYPNPSNQLFIIEIEDDLVGATINIYNSLGQKIESHISTDNQTKLESSDFKNGVYFIQLSKSSHTISNSIKFIVNH
jgi:hypothetical protein